MVVVVCDELQVLEFSASEIMSQQQKVKRASETRSEVQTGPADGVSPQSRLVS